MSRVFKSKTKVPEAKATSKRKRPEGEGENPVPKVKDEGVTLVIDTPVKSKTGFKTKSVSQTMNRTASFSLPSLSGMMQDGDDDEEEWRGSGCEDDLWGMSDTPSKSKRPRVR
jgi:hypothetical protein